MFIVFLKRLIHILTFKESVIKILITPDRFDNLDQVFFESLIANGIEENLHLDYKTRMESNAKIAKEISSFANKDGGVIIYGIREIGHKPKEIIPINEKGVRERFDQIALNGIDPPLQIRIKPIDVEVKGVKGQIFVIYIPKKYPKLHQTKYYKKYYQRTEFTSSPMSNSEIELAFNLSWETNKRMKRFLNERLSKIKSGDTPAFILSHAKMSVLMIPFDSFRPQINYNLESFTNNKREIRPIDCHHRPNFRRNIEGILYNCISPEKEPMSYVHLYRNGIIEAVNGSLLKPIIHKKTKEHMKLLKINHIEKELINSIKDYLFILNGLGVGFPIYIFISFFGVYGYFIDSTQQRSFLLDDMMKTIDRTEISLPELIVKSHDVNVEYLLKPYIDLIWNACGEPGSLNYDENGNYRW